MTRNIRAIAVIAGALACGGSEHRVADTVVTHPLTATPRVSVASSIGPAGPSVLREEINVRVGSTAERWALRWRQPPAPVCAPNQEDSQTCPCSGFAYGEMGELDLVRHAPGRPDEHFALTPLFQEGENPAGELSKDLAVLQRWPVRDSDYAAISDSVDIGPAVRARPVTRAMTLGDYDHDGRATEFLLQVGTEPCGHHESVLVGVSRANPSLHAFASVAHPERPLVLAPHTWALLLRSREPAADVEIQCGDHAAETLTEVSVRAGPAGIDGTRSVYRCTSADKRGKLVRSERI
jgi:hypothetical protein